VKTATAGTITLLNSSNEFIFADLYTFTFANGTVLRITSADINITASSLVFASVSPQVRLIRSKIKTVIGTQVDQFDLKIYADSTALIGGVLWTAFAARGGFDGATIKLERAFANVATGWGDTTNGTVIMFSGIVSEIDVSRTEIDIKVKSDLVLLNINLPRNLWQPGCVHTLYDGGCALNRATFTISGAVVGGGGVTLFNTNLGAATGYYDQGVITFTSGANNGLSRTVKTFIVFGSTEVTYPLIAGPANGDTFTIYPGCDKLQATCVAKFNNLIHFKAAPYAPAPVTLL
jgi:uncharacterized phage protein (TIGR02218 family)